jgi:hypothetical protein
MLAGSALLFLGLAASALAQACTSNFNCSLNGVCKAGACACDSPWVGPACSTLQYKVTPASAKNVWTGDENLNTWNGPILHGSDGLYHLIDPVYQHASLWNVIYIAHGVSTSPTGPYDWTSMANISHAPTINPGGLIYPDPTTGAPTYSIWLGGDILISSEASGPFVAKFKFPGGDGSNPAPAFHNGAFYLTNQGTTQILTTSSLDQPWHIFANITHPRGMPCTVEDPFLYFDTRNSIHVINHCYNTGERDKCTSSHVSSHFFSEDGKVWGQSNQPYTHTVQFDDGTSHSYCTLERPGLVFDASGHITHINLAADLVTQDEGCASRGKGCVDVGSASFLQRFPPPISSPSPPPTFAVQVR